MTKSDLIIEIAKKRPDLSVRDVERAVSAIFGEIITAMARGDRVELRGFGTFSVRRRSERLGRNPRSGESVKVAAKGAPFFKAGKQLGYRLNEPGVR